MKRTDTVRTALSRAHAALEHAQQAGSVNEASERWKEFLSSLERLWNKLESHFKASPKWEGWASPYKRTRKVDPLLKYLSHARDAYEHTASETVSRPRGRSFDFNFPDAAPTYVNEISWDGNGKLRVDMGPGGEFRITEPHVQLRPATSRGVTVGVPKAHLGAAIDISDLGALGAMALRYYEGMLDAAEGFFYKDVGTSES